MKKQRPRLETFYDNSMASPFERFMKESNNSQEANSKIEEMLTSSKESLFTALNKV